MQHGRIRTIFCRVIRRSIVKANADSKDHIGMMHGHIGFVSTVHAQHAQRLTMRGRKRAQPHERGDNRQIQRFSNLS